MSSLTPDGAGVVPPRLQGREPEAAQQSSPAPAPHALSWADANLSAFDVINCNGEWIAFREVCVPVNIETEGALGTL